MFLPRAYFFIMICSGTYWESTSSPRIQELGSPGPKLSGLHHVRAVVPTAVREGDNATLKCLFDLNGDSLYSVKWYKGGREIFRYIPREHPSIKLFPIIGLSDLFIEKLKSNGTHLFLRRVKMSLSGRYSCEVSADAPSFRTALVSGDMNVVVVPTSIPEILGMKPRYKMGDVLEVQCVSKESLPAANLSWSLNGKMMDSDYVKEVNIKKEAKRGLETVQSVLMLPLHHHHFINERIKVKCTASIHTVYWKTIELSAEEEKTKDAEPSTYRSKAPGPQQIVPNEGDKQDSLSRANCHHCSRHFYGWTSNIHTFPLNLILLCLYILRYNIIS